MTNNLDSIYDKKKVHNQIEFGIDDKMSYSPHVGKIDIVIKNKDDSINFLTLDKVHYVKNLSCNLIIGPTSRDKGFRIHEEGELSMLKRYT